MSAVELGVIQQDHYVVRCRIGWSSSEFRKARQEGEEGRGRIGNIGSDLLTLQAQGVQQGKLAANGVAIGVFVGAQEHRARCAQTLKNLLNRRLVRCQETLPRRLL